MAKLKTTSVTVLNATEDLKVNNNSVYHTGRKPTAGEIGASKLTLGTSKPTDGYWFNQVNDIANRNKTPVTIEILPEPYSISLHPITNSSAVILKDGTTLQQAIDTNSINQELINEVNLLKEAMVNMQKTYQITEEYNCPFNIGHLYYTDEKNIPSEIWHNTEWIELKSDKLLSYDKQIFIWKRIK